MLSLPADLPHAVPDPGDDAGRVGRVQSVAGADGHRHARRARPRPACMSAAPITPEDAAEIVAASAALAFDSAVPVAVLFVAAADRRQGVREGARDMRNDGTLDRRAVAATLLRDPGDLLVVTGLGAPTYDAARRRRPAAQLLSLGRHGRRGDGRPRPRAGAAHPPRAGADRRRRDADGHGLARHASRPPARANLAIAVLDNARYGETGSQPSHTGLTTDLAAVAAACGWPATATARDMDEVAALRPAPAAGEPVRRGPHLRRGAAAPSAAARRRLSGRPVPPRARCRRRLTPANCIGLYRRLDLARRRARF